MSVMDGYPDTTIEPAATPVLTPQQTGTTAETGGHFEFTPESAPAAVEPAKPRMGALIESLTGFDEIAIAAQFKRAMSAMDELMLSRAAVMILERRAGKNDHDAWLAAMNMPMRDVMASFASEAPAEQEIDLDGGDSGKAPTS